MRSDVSILYRGPLSSCNYDCSYCPFAKRHENAQELQTDREALERFVDWVANYSDGQLSLFFTPWGEALTRRWYQTAVQQLSEISHVQKIAAQTNLSWSADWLDDCDESKIGLWCTYHPTQVERDAFLIRANELRQRSISHSVGMVAIPDDYDEIQTMRSLLHPTTYMWLNAFDVGDGRKYDYSSTEMEFLTRIDPQFATNTIDHPSLGQSCDAGSDVFSINGDGDVQRCHFVKEQLGNIYSADWQFPTEHRTCPKQTCTCHIGYVHMPGLQQNQIYGLGILERTTVSPQATAK